MRSCTRVCPVDFRYAHTHKRVIALRVDQMDEMDGNRRRKKEGERERESGRGRLGTSVAGQGAAASGAGIWRVNASTSKWLAGTIIALNALSSGRAVVHPHANRGDKTHARARGRVWRHRVHPRPGRRARRILHSFAFNWTDINLKK